MEKQRIDELVISCIHMYLYAYCIDIEKLGWTCNYTKTSHQGNETQKQGINEILYA